MNKKSKIDEIYAKQRQVLHEKWQKVNEELWNNMCYGIELSNMLDWAVRTLKVLKKDPAAKIEDCEGCLVDVDGRAAVIEHAKQVRKDFPSLIKKEEVDLLRLEQEEKAAREAYKNFVPKPPTLVQVDTKKTVHQDDPCASAHGPDCNRC